MNPLALRASFGSKLIEKVINTQHNLLPVGKGFNKEIINALVL